jgi:hypothetical protein
MIISNFANRYLRKFYNVRCRIFGKRKVKTGRAQCTGERDARE